MNAGDMGRDYEHCLELQKKANDLESAVSRSLGHVLHHSFTDQFILSHFFEMVVLLDLWLLVISHCQWLTDSPFYRQMFEYV